jgi:hypothetical protein
MMKASYYFNVHKELEVHTKGGRVTPTTFKDGRRDKVRIFK